MYQISTKTVKIRKKQQCFACLETYETGTLLIRQVNVYDHGIGTVYTCPTCEVILRENKEELMDPWDRSYAEGCLCDYQL
jgi:hypothetical protein